MLDRGFFLTQQAVRRQLAAMPHPLYLVRLVHQTSRRAFPGERLWTAAELTSPATIGFLRFRNREGCDVYLHPYAENQNAGYILLDLDATEPSVLQTMRHDGCQPCVIVQTSPGHLQAWLHISRDPLSPAVATSLARKLARTYTADLASADWRHLGRLAGFTNQKPARRRPNGFAPWVKILHAMDMLATAGGSLLQSPAAPCFPAPPPPEPAASSAPDATTAANLPSVPPDRAAAIYDSWIRRWRIVQRFPLPDWSIVDLWVARALLCQGTSPAQVQAILQFGSPQFPRHHGNPLDYLHRTITRAAFSCRAPARTVCPADAPLATGSESPLAGSPLRAPR